MGWPAAASQYASRALALSCETKYTHAQVTAHNTLAFALLSQGSFLMARNEAELGIQLAQQIQAYRMLGYLHLVLGMAELALGNLREAIKQADQGLAIGKKYNYPEMLTIGHRLHGDVFAALGLSNQAFNDYQKGLEISREGFWGLDISFRLGYTLALMGQVENGLMHNTQVVAVAQQMNLHLIAVVAQISQAGLLAQTGSWERAENLARQMVSETQKRSMLNWELAAKTVLASTEVQKGDISVACALYEEIIQQSARLPYPWVELRASGNLASLTKSNFSPLQRKRMHTLLDQMAAHLPGPEDDPDYESVILAFERYRQGLLLQAAPSGC
jgi:tetratricopeptide (TPR) repeat protein